MERQPTLTDEAYDELLASNRTRYCGTLADVTTFRKAKPLERPEPKPAPIQVEPEMGPKECPEPAVPAAPCAEPPAIQEPPTPPPATGPQKPEARTPMPEPMVSRDLGKGGSKHRYLQLLVKELAESKGLKATIEAPLPAGGQVDVLIERDGVLAAVEISVSTPVEHERDNIQKCLDAGIPRIAVVLAKSKVSQSNYRTALAEGIADMDRDRVAFLTPEEIPDFVAGLAPPPAPTERIVRGYRVKGSVSSTSPEEARARRDALARLIAKSLTRQKD